MPQVLEYKCPCCDAGLIFGNEQQKLTCRSCGNDFDMDAVMEFNRIPENGDQQEICWEDGTAVQWSEAEQSALRSFECPSCGGEILAEETTAATFCPYCDNPAVLPARVSGGIRPDAIIPFQNSQKDAASSFQKLCKGKPLLPKDFAAQHRLEKITGVYVPFWLYSCNGDLKGKYRATRVHHWSDSRYHYTKTDYYLLTRAAKARFDAIPMDGSSKLDNAIMESIEPFDYRFIKDFDPGYLTGFLADKYDVEAKAGETRIRQRVNETMDRQVAASCIGYASVIPASRNLNITHSKAKYVLLPVWLLTTRYKDKLYTFAMNGQSGKMTGTFPICPKRSAAWFAGICAAVTAVVTLIQLLGL